MCLVVWTWGLAGVARFYPPIPETDCCVVGQYGKAQVHLPETRLLFCLPRHSCGCGALDFLHVC